MMTPKYAFHPSFRVPLSCIYHTSNELKLSAPCHTYRSTVLRSESYNEKGDILFPCMIHLI